MNKEKAPEREQEIMNELTEIAKPLIVFLEKNFDPHCYALVHMDCIKIIRDELHIPNQ